MKSITLTYLKVFRYLTQLNVVYFVIYNSYFGWNNLPLSNDEKICDNILKWSFVISLGIFLAAVINFIELVVNYIKTQQNENNQRL